MDERPKAAPEATDENATVNEGEFAKQLFLTLGRGRKSNNAEIVREGSQLKKLDHELKEKWTLY